MDKYSTLIIDDEDDISKLLSITIQRMGIKCVCVASVAEARAKLAHHKFQLCLTDMQLPDGDGMEIVELIQKNYSHIPVAVITAYGSVDTAVQALKSGAFDFVSKPIELEQIRGLVKSAIGVRASNAYGPHSTGGQKNILIGQGQHMQELQQQIDRLARSQAPVFIHGESGVGKELVARAIHERSPRGDKPFLPVNCGAIPGDLLESELFGHLKGSFTGASGDRQGMFQSASGGSLFLDEVADLPLAMQVKLLRAIQERKVRPIGAQEEVAVDVRIISAAQLPLADLVAAGTFRQDLYYRLDVIDLFVPPLRERPDDIPELVQYFIARIGRRSGYEVPAISDEVMTELLGYSFPGNVRELENILERCVALGEGGEIKAEDLRLPQVQLPAAGSPGGGSTGGGSPGGGSTGGGSTAREQGGEQGESHGKLDDYIESKEREQITRVLENNRWNRTRAAKELGISLRALRYRMQKLGLNATRGDKK